MVVQDARRVRRFGAWLAAERLPVDGAALEPELVTRFMASAEAERRPGVRSKRTGSLIALRSLMREVLDLLECAGIVQRSPARAMRMARVGPTPPKGLGPAEVARLLAVLEADRAQAARRDHALVAFLLGTGARLRSTCTDPAAD